MDQLFADYLEGLVKEIADKKNFGSLPEEERNQKTEQLQVELQELVLTVILHALPDEDLHTLKQFDFTQEESFIKLAEMVAKIPELDRAVEAVLEQKKADLIATPN